ncbi:MAG TPA: hypothetical protein VGO03_20440 [Acidimicrobiia bacterium]|jgi:hypothetical protein
MVDPDRSHQPARPTPSERDVVDLRSLDEQPIAETVRTVLESAADVIFSDGVSAEFLDQWTFETTQLLETRARAAAEATARKGAKRTQRPVSAGRR